MSIKTEKTLMEYKVESERGMLKLVVDPELTAAQLTILSVETQVTIPVAILSLPELAEFFTAICDDPAIEDLVEAIGEAARPIDDEIDEDAPSDVPEEA